MRIAGIVLLLLASSGSAVAQRSHGYWFIAPGGATGSAGQRGSSLTTFILHIGGGGEFAFGKGVAAGIEASAVFNPRAFNDSIFGTASANGFYHFRPSRSAILDPFATAGYTLFFRRGSDSLWNFGGGLNYWFLPHIAARVEFRDHVHGGPPRVHFWGVRFGLSFTDL